MTTKTSYSRFYAFHNRSRKQMDCDLIGWLANPVCLRSHARHSGKRTNAVVRDATFAALHCTASAESPASVVPRSDVIFDAFEQEIHEA